MPRSWQGQARAVAAVCAISLAIALAAPAAVPDGLLLDVSLGLFSGLVAAITFALVLAAQSSRSWPSALQIIRDSGALVWMLVGAGAIVVAVLAGLTGGATQESLAAAGLALSAASLVIGLWVVSIVLATAGGRGRHAMQVRVLRAELAGERRQGAPARSALDDFEIALRRAIDEQDLPTIRSRVAQLAEASDVRDRDRFAVTISLHLRAAKAIGGALIRGRLPSPATEPLRGLLESAVDQAGRRLEADRHLGDEDAEVQAAVVLGETSRLAALLGKASWQAYADGRLEAGQAVALMTTCHAVREDVRTAADPDPPARFLQPEDPWLHGLSSPEAVFVWLYGHTEFEGSNQGAALYVLFEVATGRKYFGSIAEGPCIASEIEATLRGDDEGRPEPERTREYLARVGGYERALLAIAANSLGNAKPAAWEPPLELTHIDVFDASPARRLRYFVPLGSAAKPSPDAARTLLASLLTDGAGRPTLTGDALRRYRPACLSATPWHPPAERPGAAVAAVALNLMGGSSDGEGAQHERVRAFIDPLPDNLARAADGFSSEVIGDRAGRAGRPAGAGIADRVFDRLSVVWDD